MLVRRTRQRLPREDAMGDDPKQAGQDAILTRYPPREFFRDIARERQLKRKILAELGPGSPWLDVLHGREPGGGRVVKGLKPLPGCANLPTGSATYPACVSFPVGSPLSVHGGDMPVFIQATARIAWRVLAVAAPLENPRWWQADPMDRPEWLDDPSAPLPGKRRR
jgi:hypothetical protein